MKRKVHIHIIDNKGVHNPYGSEAINPCPYELHGITFARGYSLFHISSSTGAQNKSPHIKRKMCSVYLLCSPNRFPSQWFGYAHPHGRKQLGISRTSMIADDRTNTSAFVLPPLLAACIIPRVLALSCYSG